MDKKQKLIDVDEFIRTIQYHDDQQKTDVWLTEDIEYLLAELPAVDAKPVVHGRWIDGMKCSVCGQVDWTKPNYCPNCGADMR